MKPFERFTRCIPTVAHVGDWPSSQSAALLNASFLYRTTMGAWEFLKQKACFDF